MERGWGWGRTLALIGALMLAAAALVIVPPMLVNEPAPSATPRPSFALFTASPSPHPAASFAVSPYRSVDWALAPFPEPAFQPAAVTPAGERLVAAGVSEGEVAVWYSDDGLEWERAAVPTLPATQADRQAWVSGMAATSQRILITGVWVDASGSGSPFAFSSADQGATWEAAELPRGDGDLEILSLTATGDRFVAIAYGEPNADTRMSWWTAPDGSDWQRLAAAGLPAGQPRIALAGNAGGLVAAGSDGERTESHPAAWFSPDGAAWLPSLFGVEQVGQLGLAEASEGSYLVAGQTATFGRTASDVPTAWMSPDGRRWSSVQLLDLRGAQVGAAALSDAGALLVIERLTSGEDLPVSTSVRFVRMGTTESSDSQLPLVSLIPAAMGDRFIVLGQCPASGQPDCAGTSIAIGTLVR